MKLEFTAKYFLDRLKRLDVRAQKLTDDQLYTVIDDGYSEICTVGMFFSNEEIIDMVPLYESGENVFTIDIEEDVTGVYDKYLTKEGLSYKDYDHGIRKIREVSAIYLDNRYNGKVHIDLTKINTDVIVDNAVIKYFYTPRSTTGSVFMDQQTRLATESAMGAALYDYLKDTENSSRKRAAMTRQANAIIPRHPEDLIDPKKSIFPVGA